MNIKDHPKVKKILVISLTNIGDIILTFPVVDILKENFPTAELSIITGPKGESLFKGNPHIAAHLIYDKHQHPMKTIKWLLKLRKEKFDLIVDLRNSVMPFFIGAPFKTSPVMRRLKRQHMRMQHLQRLKSVYSFEREAKKIFSLSVDEGDQQYVDDIIKNDIGIEQNFAVVSPGAADEKKRWTEEGFAKVCDALLSDFAMKVVFVGDQNDRDVIRRIINQMNHQALDLSGRINLAQLGHLLKNAKIVISNDSAPMHMASYLDIPTLALFGPTDPVKYGPWSSQSVVVGRKEEPNAAWQEELPMQAIEWKDVLKVLKVEPDGVIFSQNSQ